MERSPLMRRSRQPPLGNAGTQTSGPLSDGEKLTGWLGTIISKAVRALAEPALFGVYAVDLLSRWRALRGFRKTLEDDHD